MTNALKVKEGSMSDEIKKVGRRRNEDGAISRVVRACVG